MILIFTVPLFYIKVSKVIISQVSGLFLNWSLAFCIWEWHLDTPEVWTCSWPTDLKKIRWNGFRIKACSCLITCGLWCKLGHVNLGGISPNKQNISRVISHLDFNSHGNTDSFPYTYYSPVSFFSSVSCNPESMITLEMENKTKQNRDLCWGLWVQKKESYDTTVLIRKLYKVM